MSSQQQQYHQVWNIQTHPQVRVSLHADPDKYQQRSWLMPHTHQVTRGYTLSEESKQCALESQKSWKSQFQTPDYALKTKLDKKC